MRFRSSDGLLSSDTPEAPALWDNIGSRMRGETEAWTRHLRARGVKLAHPDDGWVDRDRNVASPCYPQFDDQPSVGDLIALGYGYTKHWGGDFNYRLCLVTKVETWRVISSSLRYHFEDTGERL